VEYVQATENIKEVEGIQAVENVQEVEDVQDDETILVVVFVGRIVLESELEAR